MTKSIKLSELNWATLHDRIKQDYPKSVWLSRDKMRRVLGFVPRAHREYKEIQANYSDFRVKGSCIEIHLDFFDDKKKTMFVMKYSEYLNDRN